MGVVIASAVVLGLALLGGGVGIGVAISGGTSNTGSGADSSQRSSAAVVHLPDELLGLDRNTFAVFGMPGNLSNTAAHPESGTYGAAFRHTPTILVQTGGLTKTAKTEARIDPTGMALYVLDMPGARSFHGRQKGVGLACVEYVDPHGYGTGFQCYSVDQRAVVYTVYLGGSASSLTDAAAKTTQIRLAVER
jgi:hypothetical protein